MSQPDIPMITPSPVPMTFKSARVKGRDEVNGIEREFFLLIVETPVGPLHLFFEPEQSLNIGQVMAQNGYEMVARAQAGKLLLPDSVKANGSGLIIPQAGQPLPE